MSENSKCTVNGSHVTPCSALSEASEGAKSGGKARGIFVWPLVNMETRKPSRTMYGAVTSAHPKGLIFNFCPWCGVDLSATHSTKQTEEGGAS